MSRSLLNAGEWRLGVTALRHLLPAVHDRAIGGTEEGSEIPMTAQPTEAAGALPEASGNPADQHSAVAPAANVADEVADEVVEVLDRVGAPQRPVERAGDAEPLQHEGLVQSFAQGRRGAGVRVLEARGKLQEAALGARRPQGRRLRRARGGRGAASAPGDVRGRCDAYELGTAG